MALGVGQKKLHLKAQGVDQQYTLKIAAAQGVCATALAVSFLPLYDPNSSTYWDLTVSSLEVVAAVWEPMAQLFLRLGAFLSNWQDFTLIFPSSFSWPDLPSGFSFAFSLSVGLAAFAALMPQLIWLYKYFELDTRGEKYFEMEEVIIQYDKKHPDREGDDCEKIRKGATYEVQDEKGAKTGESLSGVKTGRFRLKKGQCSFWVALVLENSALAGAAVLSGVQMFLVLLKNRKKCGTGKEERKKWWSLEQKGWRHRNFDHVNHATVQQFVADNPQATILFLANCTNITLMTVECIAHTWRGERLNISRCELEGMSSTASCCVLFLKCDLTGWLSTGQLPSFAQNVKLKIFRCTQSQFTGRLVLVYSCSCMHVFNGSL
jgi:hypothetical protein